jgi:hypothetical protein
MASELLLRAASNPDCSEAIRYATSAIEEGRDAVRTAVNQRHLAISQGLVEAAHRVRALAEEGK